jgi:hypothetical protein
LDDPYRSHFDVLASGFVFKFGAGFAVQRSLFHEGDIADRRTPNAAT